MAFGIIRKIAEATATLAGLMSAADKAKLDSVDVNATHTDPVVDDLMSESTTAPLSANQGRVLRGLYEGSGISHMQMSAYGLTFNITKYGRVCTVSLNTGSVSTPIPDDTVIITLPAGYRPVSWLPIPNQNPRLQCIFAINASGAVTVSMVEDGVDVMPVGVYPRFCATFITLS